ncbi:MAG: hypothetical protein IJ209_00835 [Bacteroidaceae bacterium]|nr:hypothetical protein [Bacteroidaceae bacterium]
MRFLLLLVAFFIATTMNADPKDGVVIPLNPIITTSGNGGEPRSPILVPVLYLDGYTLTAGNGTLGSTIQLLDEDGTVVYSTFVYIEGDIYLPTTLSGTYAIRIKRGSQTFEGTISL